MVALTAAVVLLASVASVEAVWLVSMTSGLPSSFTDLSVNRGGKEGELGGKSRLAQRCPSFVNGMTTEFLASVDFAATLEYI